MIIKILNFILGDNKNKRFTRVVVLLIIASVSIMLIKNVGCGVYQGKFYFEWNPANFSDLRK